MHDLCAYCGHARVFHQIGTGHGVPVGVPYCDDRHSEPCNCAGFVEQQSWAEMRAQRKKERIVRWCEKQSPRPKSIYIIGSLRNPRIPEIGSALRARGWDAFDDWHSAGEHADDAWRDYERSRGHSLPKALDGYAAQHTFNFDKTHLDRCEYALLVLPAGKSGHLELGYAIGQGKPSFILLDGDPDRYDVMYAFACSVFERVDDMLMTLDNLEAV